MAALESPPTTADRSPWLHHSSSARSASTVAGHPPAPPRLGQVPASQISDHRRRIRVLFCSVGRDGLWFATGAASDTLEGSILTAHERGSHAITRARCGLLTSPRPDRLRKVRVATTRGGAASRGHRPSSKIAPLSIALFFRAGPTPFDDSVENFHVTSHRLREPLKLFLLSPRLRTLLGLFVGVFHPFTPLRFSTDRPNTSPDILAGRTLVNRIRVHRDPIL